VRTNLIERKVDVAIGCQGVQDDKTGKYVTLPYGLLYKFISLDTDLPSKEEFLKEQEKIWSSFHLTDFEENQEIVKYSLTLSTIKRYYALGYQRSAQFFKYYYKDEDLYNEFMEKAYRIDPIFSTFLK
jgi:hypothetical protein